MKPLGKKIKIVLSGLFVIAALSIAIFPAQQQIVSPRLTLPVIKLAGQSFEIEVRHSVGFSFSDWQVGLIDYKGDAVALPVLDTSIGFGVSRLIVSLPQSMVTGQYTLVLGDSLPSNTLFSKNAVYVRDHMPEDISIIQLADLPTLGGDESGDKALEGIIEEINIINPDVVLFSGDLAYGGSWDQYRRLLALLEQLEVPLITVPGNHAYYGWAGYLSLLGRPYHQVELGDYQFIGLNSGHGRDQMTMSQLRWLETTVSQSPAKHRILQLHHPIHHPEDLGGYLRANRHRLLRIIEQSEVAIVLSGHWHGDSVYDDTGTLRTDSWDFTGTPFVVTTTAGADLRPNYSNSPLHFGYRLIRFVNGVLENYTYDYDGDGSRDATSSIPVGKLKVVPRGRYGVGVHNELNEGFLNARVKIHIPDADNNYLPNRGKVENVIRKDGESIYSILVDIPANRKTAISMVQEGYND
ncbi:MAG: metallophosphoesterase [Thiohalomonadales bacterium]